MRRIGIQARLLVAAALLGAPSSAAHGHRAHAADQSPNPKYVLLFRPEDPLRPPYAMQFDPSTGRVSRFLEEEFDTLRFSPDGRRFIYSAGPRNDRHRLWVANADGTGRHALTPAGVVGAGSWSSDGKTILYSFIRLDRKTPAPGLYTVPAAGGQSRLLLGRFGHVTPAFPEWSPDGRHIAFGNFGGTGVWIAGRDGRNIRLLRRSRIVKCGELNGTELNGTLEYYGVQWLGRRLLYEGRYSCGFGIQRRPVVAVLSNSTDGGTERRILGNRLRLGPSGSDYPTGKGSALPAPDGRAIAYFHYDADEGKQDELLTLQPRRSIRKLPGTPLAWRLVP